MLKPPALPYTSARPQATEVPTATGPRAQRKFPEAPQASPRGAGSTAPLGLAACRAHPSPRPPDGAPPTPAPRAARAHPGPRFAHQPGKGATSREPLGTASTALHPPPPPHKMAAGPSEAGPGRGPNHSRRQRGDELRRDTRDAGERGAPGVPQRPSSALGRIPGGVLGAGDVSAPNRAPLNVGPVVRPCSRLRERGSCREPAPSGTGR